MIETITPSIALSKPPRAWNDTPIIAIDTPVIFEDEGQEEMGDSAPHTTATEILHCGIGAHLEDKPVYQVFSNLNLHYHPVNAGAYVSPDVMVVEPFQRLPEEISSYRIGEQGPAPILTVEVLSPRTAQQRDLTDKPKVYSNSGVAEYLLVDPSGKFLAERLLIRRRQPDGSWIDSQDADGGVTSALGFRVVFDDDGKLRVINAKSGRRYVRPREADRTVMEIQRQADENAKKLEAEIARLKSLLPPEHRG